MLGLVAQLWLAVFRERHAIGALRGLAARESEQTPGATSFFRGATILILAPRPFSV